MTLLLGNVIVNETLPVVLDSELGGGVVAILISTMLIVIFGEYVLSFFPLASNQVQKGDNYPILTIADIVLLCRTTGAP